MATYYVIHHYDPPLVGKQAAFVLLEAKIEAATRANAIAAARENVPQWCYPYHWIDVLSFAQLDIITLEAIDKCAWVQPFESHGAQFWRATPGISI